MIKVLDQETINKIAAGEVVERPSSVVKELVENAIDAGATAVTVEIKEGGLSFIRITDNGSGIAKDEVPTAFIRHATSKIMTIEDLLSISSLGFRGEALASIAAVAQVECITKTAHDLTGLRYEIHGGQEIAKEEIGAPSGTTLIIRNLFYNVPARKKFLKTPMTEGSYITELLTRLALSRPDISFKYIMNGNSKIATSGNGKLKDVVYHIYGKEVSSNLLPIKRNVDGFTMEGYVGKSFISKGNRSFEHYFVNGRFIRSNVVTKAIEEAYKSFVMIHKFPFTCVHLSVDSQKLDVNVHPTKMEFKYADSEQLFNFVKDTVRQALLQEQMIPDVSLRTGKEQRAIMIEQQKKQTAGVPEPFETNLRAKRYQDVQNEKYASQSKEEPQIQNKLHTNTKTDYQNKAKDTTTHCQEDRKGSHTIQTVDEITTVSQNTKEFSKYPDEKHTARAYEQKSQESLHTTQENSQSDKPISNKVQESLSHLQIQTEQRSQEEMSSVSASVFQDIHNIDTAQHLSDEQLEPTSTIIETAPNSYIQSTSKEEQLSMNVEMFLSQKARKKHRLIGQVFRTYWMIEYENTLYIVDQHAAHEKIMFEHLMQQMKNRNVLSQQLLPPKVIHLSSIEHNLILNKMDLFLQTGFEIEDFGDDSIVIRSMPDDIMGVDPQLLFDTLLNALVDDIGKINIDFFVEKLSGMACKAAIKGNTEITYQEADALIDELLTLENPYNCPHGRPTMISLTKTELERKFKRIQN